MNQPDPDFDFLLRRLERMISRLELMRIDAYLRYVHQWAKRLCFEFLVGIARGLGFSVGFSILGALLLYVLRHVALANLPVIGRFLADLVRIVENNL